MPGMFAGGSCRESGRERHERIFVTRIRWPVCPLHPDRHELESANGGYPGLGSLPPGTASFGRWVGAGRAGHCQRSDPTRSLGRGRGDPVIWLGGVFDVKGLKFRKILIAACIISPLLLFGVVAVLADVWSGPANRTTAGTCDYASLPLRARWFAARPAASPNINICDAACANPPAVAILPRTVNNPGSSLPDATVSGSTSCSSPGNNGWCKGVGTLSPEREMSLSAATASPASTATRMGIYARGHPAPGTSRRGLRPTWATGRTRPSVISPTKPMLP